jgi:predicted DNA-binding transcriptional regulator YafY
MNTMRQQPERIREEGLNGTQSREAGQVMARQWEMLKMLPKVGQGLTAGELVSKLADRSYVVHRRTVERDLLDLQRLFPIRVAGTGRPQRWVAYRGIEVEGLSLADAMSLQLVAQYLHPLVPAVVMDRLKPLLALASSKLNQPSGPALRSWTEKVAVVHRGVTTLAPAVLPKVLENVQNALLAEVTIQATYRRSDGTRATNEVLSPLGLIMRGNATYLIAANTKRKPLKPHQYPLHRMLSAQPTYEPAQVPDGFNLAEFVQSGQAGFGDNEVIALEAWVSPMMALQLADVPLSGDQRIEHGQGRCKLRATVRKNWQLRWWILGQSADFVVTKPRALRTEIRVALENGLHQYAARGVSASTTSRKA